MIKHGTRVTLTNDTYQTSVTGFLHDPNGTDHGHVHTIILDDGTRYRNEGRLTRAETSHQTMSEAESTKTRGKRESRFLAPWNAVKRIFLKR